MLDIRAIMVSTCGINLALPENTIIGSDVISSILGLDLLDSII